MTRFTDAYSQGSKAFRAAVTEALRPLGLHLGQNLVIAALADRDGQTPGELATAVGVSTPTIVKMATRMTAAGLVERRRDADDHRLVRIHLTEDGRSLVEHIDAALKIVDERLLDGLSKADRETLLDLMGRVTANARTLLAEWDATPE